MPTLRLSDINSFHEDTFQDGKTLDKWTLMHKHGIHYPSTPPSATALLVQNPQNNPHILYIALTISLLRLCDMPIMRPHHLLRIQTASFIFTSISPPSIFLKHKFISAALLSLNTNCPSIFPHTKISNRNNGR